MPAARPALPRTALAVPAPPVVRSVRRLLVVIGVLCLLLAVALPVAGQPRLDPSSTLRNDVQATRDEAEVPLTAVFSIGQDAEVYLKVSPVPGNPVFGNGTADASGWWTHLRLQGPDGATMMEIDTVGDPPTQFGTLRANTTYVLELLVHAPAGAFASARDWTADYILAEHVPSGQAGSGGTLDESLGLHVTLRVQGEPAPEAKPAVATDLLWLYLLAGAAVVAAAIGVAAFLLRRRTGREPGQGR